MRNFKQLYRTILASFFLCTFLSISVIDFSCFLDREVFTESENHSHSNGHKHNHSHSSKKVVLPKNVSIAKDNSCCKEEALGYYSAINKIVVSHSIHIELPPFLWSHFELALPTVIEELIYSKKIIATNKAPPILKERIYLDNSILII